MQYLEILFVVFAVSALVSAMFLLVTGIPHPYCPTPAC